MPLIKIKIFLLNPFGIKMRVLRVINWIISIGSFSSPLPANHKNISFFVLIKKGIDIDHILCSRSDKCRWVVFIESMPISNGDVYSCRLWFCVWREEQLKYIWRGNEKELTIFILNGCWREKKEGIKCLDAGECCKGGLKRVRIAKLF